MVKRSVFIIHRRLHTSAKDAHWWNRAFEESIPSKVLVDTESVVKLTKNSELNTLILASIFINEQLQEAEMVNEDPPQKVRYFNKIVAHFKVTWGKAMNYV